MTVSCYSCQRLRTLELMAFPLSSVWELLCTAVSCYFSARPMSDEEWNGQGCLWHRRQTRSFQPFILHHVDRAAFSAVDYTLFGIVEQKKLCPREKILFLTSPCSRFTRGPAIS